ILECLKYNNYDFIYNVIICTNNKKLFANDRIGPHNLDIISLIIGSLLGDSHLEKRNKGTRILFEQSNKNVEYLMWFHKYLSLRGYCNNKTPKLHKRIKKEGIFYHYRVNSYTFNSLTWIHDIFYKWDSDLKKYVKIVPNNIKDFITPLILAIWFMDDGSKINSSLKIATNNFKFSEIEFLCNQLFLIYNITASVQKAGKNKGYILYIHKNSKEDFIKIVKPYFHPSMYYKLDIKS
uniref:LAGLIDADG endonuclease n=1 Tax=Amoeboaphelidium protococcarum TaxID=1243177 RepID=UPI0022388A06